jgi:hypothetical protein
MEEMLGVALGEFNPDGSIKIDAPMCAVTGRHATGNHQSRYRISGTLYFYRVLSDFDHLATDEWRAAFESQVKGFNRGAAKRPSPLTEE